MLQSIFYTHDEPLVRTLHTPKGATPILVSISALAVLLAGCSSTDDTEAEAAGAAATSSVLQTRIEAERAQVETTATPTAEAPTTGGPTEPVPAPQGGDIHTEVDSGEQTYLRAVDIQDLVEIRGEVSLEVVDTRVIDVEARLPGELSGPAVVAELRITNDSEAELPLNTVTVTAEDAESEPLIPLSGAPSSPFEGELAVGETVEATYVFRLNDSPDGSYVLTVNPAPHLSVAVFRGSLN